MQLMKKKKHLNRKESFMAMQRGGGGNITFNDMKFYVLQRDPKFSMKDLKIVWDVMDKQKSGEISFSMFIKFGQREGTFLDHCRAFLDTVQTLSPPLSLSQHKKTKNKQNIERR